MARCKCLIRLGVPRVYSEWRETTKTPRHAFDFRTGDRSSAVRDAPMLLDRTDLWSQATSRDA